MERGRVETRCEKVLKRKVLILILTRAYYPTTIASMEDESCQSKLNFVFEGFQIFSFE